MFWKFSNPSSKSKLTLLIRWLIPFWWRYAIRPFLSSFWCKNYRPTQFSDQHLQVWKIGLLLQTVHCFLPAADEMKSVTDLLYALHVVYERKTVASWSHRMTPMRYPSTDKHRLRLRFRWRMLGQNADFRLRNASRPNSATVLTTTWRVRF